MTTVILYSSQPDAIAQQIKQGQTHHAKMQNIREKYGKEVAPIFTSAYQWFIRHAEQIIPRPDEAESAIWAYGHLRYMEEHEGFKILTLSVPVDQAIFFSMADWNKILNQRYIGLSDQENQAFSDKLTKQGISYEGDVFRKPFYPQLKQEIMKSWQNLFRFHTPTQEALRLGEEAPIKDMQAALWALPTSWLVGR